MELTPCLSYMLGPYLWHVFWNFLNLTSSEYKEIMLILRKNNIPYFTKSLLFDWSCNYLKYSNYDEVLISVLIFKWALSLFNTIHYYCHWSYSSLFNYSYVDIVPELHPSLQKLFSPTTSQWYHVPREWSFSIQRQNLLD